MLIDTENKNSYLVTVSWAQSCANNSEKQKWKEIRRQVLSICSDSPRYDHPKNA